MNVEYPVVLKARVLLNRFRGRRRDFILIVRQPTPNIRSELVIRRTDNGNFDVFDTCDSNFELKDITDSQLLGYLRNRKLVDTTAEAVLAMFDSDARRSSVRVVIDRSL